MNTKDLATVYAAARVAFTHIFEASKKYEDDSLDNAIEEILSIETILERYMEEPNGSEDVQDN